MAGCCSGTGSPPDRRRPDICPALRGGWPQRRYHRVVLDYLIGRGTPFLVLPTPDSVSVEQTAAEHGISIKESVRTEVVVGRMGTALMVIPAERVLDLDLARAAMNDREARLATHAEIRERCADCEPGAVPPLSMLFRAPMYVDPAVPQLQQVVFPLGRPGVIVCMQREELFRDDPYAVAPLTKESHIPEPLIAPSRRRILTDDDLLPVHIAEQRRRTVGVA